MVGWLVDLMVLELLVDDFQKNAKQFIQIAGHKRFTTMISNSRQEPDAVWGSDEKLPDRLLRLWSMPPLLSGCEWELRLLLSARHMQSEVPKNQGSVKSSLSLSCLTGWGSWRLPLGHKPASIWVSMKILNCFNLGAAGKLSPFQKSVQKRSWKLQQQWLYPAWP